MSSDSSKSKNRVPQIKPWSSLPDRDKPYLSSPPVWKVGRHHRLALLLDRLLKAHL